MATILQRIAANAGELARARRRYRRGETGTPSYEAYNPFRRHHQQQGPYA
ncbi:MAG: hypothetical protein ACR2MP_06865 [Streptosporangiaceae bacterium]